MMVYAAYNYPLSLKDPSQYSPPDTQTSHFIDDTGPGTGGPPDLPWPEEYQ
jgi:hypothetical protein